MALPVTSVVSKTIVEGGPSWDRLIPGYRIPEYQITQIRTHLRATHAADTVYTDWYGSIADTPDDRLSSHRMMLAGRDGTGRRLRRTSFDQAPDSLLASCDSIFLCSYAVDDGALLRYVLIDIAEGDKTIRKLMCLESDFVRIYRALRMGGHGGVLWRGSSPTDSSKILDLSVDDFQFEGGIYEKLIEQTVRFLEGDVAQQLRSWGLPPKRGVVLHGPPGNGKTVLLRLCAQRALESGLNVVMIEGNRKSRFSYDNRSMGIGDELQQAAAHGPALLLFEDIDLHCPRREDELTGGKIAQDSSNLAEVLEFLDGSVSTEGYVLLATTNYVERLDPALVRPGRLDEIISVSPPSIDARLAGLQRMLRAGPKPVPDLRPAAVAPEGRSFADIAEVSRRFKIAAAFTPGADLAILLSDAVRSVITERAIASSTAINPVQEPPA